MRGTMMTAGLAMLAASTMLPAGAIAQAPAPSCPADPVAPPAEMAAWSARTVASAAATPAGLKRAMLAPGAAIDAALVRTAGISYAVRPEKPGGSVSYGGMFQFDVKQPGTYRVALGSGAWIDILKGKTAIASSAHGHGPDCTGIRKMVDFPLEPGRYVLQIAAHGAPSLPVMLLRLP